MGCNQSSAASSSGAMVPTKPVDRKQTKSSQVEVITEDYFGAYECQQRGLSTAEHPKSVLQGGGVTKVVFKQSSTFPVESRVESVDLHIFSGFDPMAEVSKKPCQDDCEFQVFPDKTEGATCEDIAFGLFDGHGSDGQKVSHLLTAKFVPTMIRNGINSQDRDVASALEITMLHLHSQLKAADHINMKFSGSTGVISLLREGKLYVANVGDSRALVLSRERGVLVPHGMTEDHKVDDEEEKRRIIKMGGRVERLLDENGDPCGPQRAWLLEENTPGIAMSRSLGDAVAHNIGIISNADVKERVLKPEDEYLVMASDGVWEVMSLEDVAAFLDECVKKQGGAAQDGEMLSKALCAEALKRWDTILKQEDVLVDDISAMVCKFKSSKGSSSPSAASRATSINVHTILDQSQEGGDARASTRSSARKSRTTTNSVRKSARSNRRSTGTQYTDSVRVSTRSIRKSHQRKSSKQRSSSPPQEPVAMTEVEIETPQANAQPMDIQVDVEDSSST